MSDYEIKQECRKLLTDIATEATELGREMGHITNCDEDCMEVMQYDLITVLRLLKETRELYYGRKP